MERIAATQESGPNHDYDLDISHKKTKFDSTAIGPSDHSRRQRRDACKVRHTYTDLVMNIVHMLPISALGVRNLQKWILGAKYRNSARFRSCGPRLPSFTNLLTITYPRTPNFLKYRPLGWDFTKPELEFHQFRPSCPPLISLLVLSKPPTRLAHPYWQQPLHPPRRQLISWQRSGNSRPISKDCILQ